MYIITFVAVTIYILCIAMFWNRIKGATISEQPDHGRSRLQWLVVIIVILHGMDLFSRTIQGQAVDFALGHVFSLVCLMTVIVFLAGSLTRPILNLGVLVMPIGLLGLLIGALLSGQSKLISEVPGMLWLHLAIALLAFGILCIAAAQALVLYIQENQLHSPNPGGLFPALPAIDAMESNLFTLTLIGAVLLTLNLVTGMMSSYTLNGQTLVFNHHILLSIMAWLGFSGLVLGHKIYGWRGHTAAKWTLGAFILLLLAYFGSRFVTTIILA